jgi:hypothetical protein
MKARIKDFDDQPDFAKCCFTSNAALMEICGTIIDVEPAPSSMQLNPCPWCRTDYNGHLLMKYINKHIALPIDCIDLDEGELN